MKRARGWLPVVGAVAVIGVLSAISGFRPVTVLLEPLQSGCTAAADWLDTHLFAGRWERQWEQARDELYALRTQVAELDDLQEENAFLREFLQLKETRRDLQLTAARVIAADPADPYDGFCLNVGTLDGVKAGDPVLSQDGLAGVVAQAGPNWATVRTLLHPSMTVGVRVSPTGEDGVTAAEGELRIRTLPRGCTAAAGDLVVTSGLGGVYPAGLPVGTAGTPVPDPDGISMYAPLTLFFTPDETKRVMVITDFADNIEE
ncbi:MAG: rod shape-determining protein MreC [Clostridia bacterium]|nr:rod shape-determining protein MreC [Clostridia bacterium]